MEELEILKQLADDPSEVVFEEGSVLFTRGGKDYSIEISTQPGIGLAVKTDVGFVPLIIYIQKEILNLHILAKQIAKYANSRIENRPFKYIETEATYIDKTDTTWHKTSLQLKEKIVKPLPFVTQVIQLMAAAGQGKTALLDQLSVILANEYQPDRNPTPILLTVDLVGKYVGSVEDAIAGMLNNTILFPGLGQKDINLCIKNNWMSLALDGFDELVARIGTRDAFLKINELIEKLESSGTILISARESFFELSQIKAAIQSYIKPNKGAYSTSIIKLSIWGPQQCKEVFKMLGSKNPDEDYKNIEKDFSQDKNFLNNPFFLTRIAKYWIKGEKFEQIKGESNRLSRIKYILEIYIQRETEEKWGRLDDEYKIDADMHNYILGCIAEEMWKTSNYKLSSEELGIATQIALVPKKINPEVQDKIITRIPYHAAFSNVGNTYMFLHEQFFTFYLGYRLAYLLKNGLIDDFEKVISSNELSSTIFSWIEFNLTQKDYVESKIIDSIEKIKNNCRDLISKINLSTILIIIYHINKPKTNTVINNYIFSEQCFNNKHIVNISFISCEFWNTSFTNSNIENCIFKSCNISSISIDSDTIFKNVIIEDSLPKHLIVDENEEYSPKEIENILLRKGIKINRETIEDEAVSKVNKDIGKKVLRLIKWSNKYTYIEMQEINTVLGSDIKEIINYGLQTEIMKHVVKDASGSKKFVKIVCDKDNLIKGQVFNTNDERINKFWEKLSQKYPNA